ncbi:GNAT family N-acetyltransferase [Leifsonia kafniensis]|uniref:GNAT family N-acetyltransferase n=1 Tax=Leifsonia kafniensis TaxID=475957 RepID=A0ABP7K9E7_9MICO
MAIEVRAATKFDDVKTMVGPKRADANVCWCLSYRIPSKQNIAALGPERGEIVKNLCRQDPPPGVLAYEADEVVGWAAVHPRADTGFARKRGAPAVEGYPVDNAGQTVDLTMAYVGTRTLFERAGFTKAADTDSVLNGFPRILMRLDLS